MNRSAVMTGLISIVLLFCTVPSGAAGEVNTPVQATLENGMRVVIIQNHLAPVVTTDIVYNVGSVDDTIAGIAHATEHMLFRGTDDLSSDQFANIATRIGAQYDAATTVSYTNYYFTVPASYLDVVLRIEADRMQHAAMRESDWTFERGAIEQEVQAHLSNPVYKAILPVDRVFFGDSPWGRDPVGTIAGFEKMHAADIAAFYHTWYHPNNATLLIVGDIDPQAALAAVRQLFGPIPQAPLPAHPPLPVNPIASTSLDETVDFPLPISIVAMRVPGSDDPQWPAIEVLFGALSSGRSEFADLMLRGKALAAVAFANAQRGGGVATFGSIALPGSDPATGVAQLRGVIDDYAKNGLPSDLILDTKQSLLASQAYLSASIPGEASQWAQSYAVLGRAPQSLFEALEAVSPDDVNRVFKTYIAGGSAVDAMLRANPKAAAAAPASMNAAENVRVTTTKDVALPAWTQPYFDAPLRAPRIDDPATIVRLKNGMTIAVREEHDSPAFVVYGHILNNTDLYEPKGKEGVGAMTSSLLIFGTTSYDYKAYQAAVEHVAAQISLGTDFSAQAPAAAFDKTIELLADGELHPAFAPQRFALVQADAVKAAAALEDRPEERAALARLYAMYPPGDPHRRHSTAHSLSAVTLDDVKRWYDFAYRPDLTTVAVVGDVTPDQVRAAFERYFGAWSAHGPAPSMAYPPIKGAAPKKSVTIASTTTTQADVSLTQPLRLRRGDRDAVVLQLANTMLSGEGTGSMLFRDVRSEHGFVYSIDSSLDVTDTGSTFALTFASDPKNVDRAQRAAAATIDRLRQYPPSVSDLTAAKAMLLSKYVVGLDSYSSVAGDLLRSTEDGIDANDVSRYYALVLATTPQDVMHAMKRWIDPAHFVRVLVVPAT